MTFYEVTDFHVIAGGVTNGFGLDKGGEGLFLSHLPGGGLDRVVDCVRFKGQVNGITVGRYPDGDSRWEALAPTPGSSNVLWKRSVVISEIMYHAAATPANPEDNTRDEYIELRNVSGSTVDLWTAAGPVAH